MISRRFNIKRALNFAPLASTWLVFGCTAPLGDGLSEQSDCLTCHTENGPLIESQTDAGVSALEAGHARHKEAGIGCETCHIVPTDVGDKRHLGSLPAEVVFSGNAAAGTATPFWNTATLRCEGTYCHGGTSVGGSDSAPSFSDTTDQALSCNSCHGDPPDTGAHALHSAANYPCETCHIRPAAFEISKHVDGAPAEVTFGPQASPSGGFPIYDPRQKNCAQTFCHGAGLTGGMNRTPRWETPVAPTTCDSCHGNPPTSGAHQRHIEKGTACEECHMVPDTIAADGHMDPLPVEVVLSGRAILGGSKPMFTTDTKNCTNTYCHGATQNGGVNQNPAWTPLGTGNTTCDSCHGNPPLTTHFPEDTNCNMCHGSTVNPDGTVNWTARFHINGVTDF